jgi:hypothetical protein
MSHAGHCLCGAVRFTAENVRPEQSACHCGMCRRWSGGSPFFAVRAENVTFEGESNIGRYDSSDWAQRGFCKTCGTALFYYFKAANRYAMSAGVFDDNAKFVLAREIFIDDKPEGYAFAGEHPRWTAAETIEKMTKPNRT